MALALLLCFTSATVRPCEAPCGREEGELTCGSLNRSLSCEELSGIGCSCIGCCRVALELRSMASLHAHQAMRVRLSELQAEVDEQKAKAEAQAAKAVAKTAELSGQLEAIEASKEAETASLSAQLYEMKVRTEPHSPRLSSKPNPSPSPSPSLHIQTQTQTEPLILGRRRHHAWRRWHAWQRLKLRQA